MIEQGSFSLLPYVSLRAAAMFFLLPLPPEVFSVGRKLMLSLLLGILALPYVEHSGETQYIWFLSEIGIGLLLGLPISLMIALTGVFAELFDLQRGQTFASFYDPAHGPGSQCSLLFRSYFICFLLLSGCGEALFVNFLDSLQYLPAGTDLFSRFSDSSSQGLLLFVHSALNTMLTVYLPVAGIFFFVDLCFCFASKALPKLQIYQDAFLVKTFLGFLALLLLVRSGVMEGLVMEYMKPIYRTVVVS